MLTLRLAKENLQMVTKYRITVPTHSDTLQVAQHYNNTFLRFTS